jgi:hypothetical protein
MLDLRVLVQVSASRKHRSLALMFRSKNGTDSPHVGFGVLNSLFEVKCSPSEPSNRNQHCFRWMHQRRRIVQAQESIPKEPSGQFISFLRSTTHK